MAGGSIDYYAALGIPPTATQQQIRDAYKKAALKTHPDRVPSDSPERPERTRKFQLINDAYYTLSEPSRRREYDTARRSHGFGSGASTASTAFDSDEDIPDPGPTPGGFPWSSFGFSSRAKSPEEQQRHENEQFGDVFEEMLKEEGMAENGGRPTGLFWSVVGGLSGGAMGFIIANFPGMLAGAVAGNRLGAVRDAKGKSVYEAPPICRVIDARSRKGKLDHLNKPVTLILNPRYPKGEKPLQYLDVVLASDDDLQLALKNGIFDGISGGEDSLIIGSPDKFKIPRSQLEISAPLGTPGVKLCKLNSIETLPSAGECFSLINQWLEDCSTYHECISPNSSPLPKRVIDVGPSDGSEQPRLLTQTEIEGHGVPIHEYGEYVALSYCWGKTPFLTTTSSTLEKHKVGMSMDSLPQTIQDAITIVRRLNIRYLWVDSLCILQGADESAQKDWEIESAKMGSIYQNASLTIAVAWATAAHDGIFKQRDTNPQCILPFCGSSLRFGLPRLRPAEEPLYTRGWTLQEDLLSKRILRYGAKEISWQCSCAEWAEGDWKPPPFTTEKKMPPTTRLKILNNWESIVESFTCRELSKTSDRLPALDGLSNIFRDQYGGGIYCFGLWQEHLPWQLLWEKRGLLPPKRDQNPDTTATTGIPSWSWAAVDGRITFLRFRLGNKTPFYVEITDNYVKNTFPSLSITKIISPSRLQVKGCIIPIASIRYVTRWRYGEIDILPQWGKFPYGMETCLDNAPFPPAPPRADQDLEAPEELKDSWFLLVGNGAGLVLLPALNSGAKEKGVGVNKKGEVEGFGEGGFGGKG
ncbi:hypothetical protein G7Y89_g13534 [Cudoniella acicularis]|uniref:J domain-containing protein n=1 Tax=Cudoniella acicularis TaxID=354080 RepID=A0A8H4R9N3_9HELO|nr:hypothetical protein G7Y89_g13534 [Cudoniella acicularis]